MYSPVNKLPKLREFMDQVVPTLAPDTPVMKAVSYLLRHRVTGAPVVDPTGRLLGIITESDLLKLITEGIDAKPPIEAKVVDFMTTDVVTVSPEEDIYYVAGVFNQNTFRRLPVIENNKIVGAITRFDLLRVIQAMSAIYW